MPNREPVDEHLDSLDKAHEEHYHGKDNFDAEFESCPECGSNLEYIPGLGWGLLYCTKCPWEQRL